MRQWRQVRGCSAIGSNDFCNKLWSVGYRWAYTLSALLLAVLAFANSSLFQGAARQYPTGFFFFILNNAQRGSHRKTRTLIRQTSPKKRRQLSPASCAF